MPPVAAQPVAGQRKKRSRKQQLRDIAADKKRRRDEAVEAADLWVPPESDEEQEHEDELVTMMEVVGEASVRQDQNYRQRRSTERMRGVSQQARAMAAYLENGQPQAVRDSRQLTLLATQCVAAAIAKALAIDEQERVAQLAAQLAAEARARYVLKKRAAPATPTARPVYPRQQRTFSYSSDMSRKRSRVPEGARSSKRLRVRLLVTKPMRASLARLTKTRCFKRHDVVDGAMLSRVEWRFACRDYKELVKIFALNMYMNKRVEGMNARTAYNEAAKVATTPSGDTPHSAHLSHPTPVPTPPHIR